MLHRTLCGLGAIAALTLTSGTASAGVEGGYDTIKWDLNQFEWNTGRAGPLTADFTGVLNWRMSETATLQDLEARNGGLLGSYMVIGDPGTLSEVDGRLFFENGFVTGGDAFWLNSDGDRVAAFFEAAGRLIAAPGGFASVSGLIEEAVIEDSAGVSTFGDVFLSTIFGGDSESESLSLFGDFVFQRLELGAIRGTVDAEFAMTIVPTPASAALLGAGGLLATRRRR